MVLLVKTYKCSYSPYWLGGSPITRWHFDGLVAVYEVWLVYDLFNMEQI